MHEIAVKSPNGRSAAYAMYYSSLASHFVRQLKQATIRVILEAGCGRGQLTIPLLRKLPQNVRMIAVDSSSGPYSGWFEELPHQLRLAGLDARVRLVNADARRVKGVGDESVDAVVSNELLCDLTKKTELEKALNEFYRILRPRGIMVHGEWSSQPASGSQPFLAKHWPSWNPDQLQSSMQNAGFDDFHVTYFDTTITFGYEAAVEELRSWGAKKSFLKQHDKSLKNYGIKLPFEHLIRCSK